jgi:hypothetical protein
MGEVWWGRVLKTSVSLEFNPKTEFHAETRRRGEIQIQEAKRVLFFILLLSASSRKIYIKTE